MKTAIITGASGNLGKALVSTFLSNGYKVIATVTSNDPSSLATEDQHLEKSVVDLLDEEDTAAFAKSVLAKYTAIDTAIFTVGGFAMGSINETSTTDILHQYRLNFETTYNIARPIFADMRKQKKGRIFLVGSKTGLDVTTGSGMTAYSLAKSLIFRLAELMNEEAKGTGVVTSVVVPGTIDTPQNRKAMPDADVDKWVKADDIARIISYYSSVEAATLRAPIIKVYGNS